MKSGHEWGVVFDEFFQFKTVVLYVRHKSQKLPREKNKGAKNLLYGTVRHKSQQSYYYLKKNPKYTNIVHVHMLQKVP